MPLELRQSGKQSGWKQALVFNSLLIVIAILAARIIISAFAGQGFGANPTPEALAETRRSIDAAFVDMVPKTADPKEFWSDQVDRELRDRNMAAARGFLLAAPQMLDRDTARSVKAAADTELSGTEEQRLVRAALFFLPNDVRIRYERAIRPPEIDMPLLDTPDTELTEAEPAPEEAEDVLPLDEPPTTAPTPSVSTATLSRSFSMLGDLEDLTSTSQKWMNGDLTDSFELRMAGLATVSPESVPGINMGEAASILKAARRARRLTPQYARLLEQRLNTTLPEDDLHTRLEDALSVTAPLSVLGPRVLAAFEQSIDLEDLPPLAVEIEQVNRIAEATDPASAIALIEHVRNPGDMRRARLVAEAGGERAAALVSQIGGDTLDLAESGISWSRALILQVLGLLAAALVLLWTVFTAIIRAFSSRTRPMELI